MFRVLGALIFATGYDPAVEMSRLDRLTLADFFRGWSPTLQSLFLGLARNFTSARPDQVPQSGFIAFLRFYTLLRRDSWNFSYFAQDSHRAVIAPLVERITQGGGNLMLGAHVTDLERNGTRWRVRWQSEGTSQVVDADQVILALDIPGTRKLLTHSLDAKALTFPLAVPSAILRYWFDCAPTGGIAGPEAGIFTGEFVLDNYFWLHRFQEPFVRWHAVTGGSAIECHIYGPPELLAEPDAVILARGAQELQRVWSDLRGALVTQSIRRNPAAHSLFSGETERSLAVQTPWPGVWACGDWLRYPHPALYMERAIVTGIAAANGVLQSLGQPEHPIIPVDRPEVLARGIEAGLRWIRRQARRAKTRRAAQ
jgi:isorenieratene synthase